MATKDCVNEFEAQFLVMPALVRLLQLQLTEYVKKNEYFSHSRTPEVGCCSDSL
jgi:hypothetical protein